MKLDPDIVRQLLLDIEAAHTDHSSVTSVSSNNYPRFYAASLLIEARYVVGDDDPDTLDAEASWLNLRRMTYSGHELLNSIRDESIWKLAKEGGKSLGGTTIEVLGKIAKAYAQKKIEEHTGLKL